MTVSRMRDCAHGCPALRPDRALQFRILLGPAPSLRELRRSRGHFVRSLLCFFGQVRLLPRAHRRLRPPAFPTRSRPRLVGTGMEISRFPGRRLLHIPGSATTRGWLVSCDDDTDHLAFCWTENISGPIVLRRSIPSLRTPLSTLRLRPHDHTRMTRGRCSSLRLHRDGLAPSTFRRFPGAPVHSINSRLMHRSKNDVHELAYSITSSASNCIEAGTASPSALAVLRL